MRIGELAEIVGIATSAVRYYERAGILPKARRVSGRRIYDDDAVKRLRMVKLAQSAGLSLAETKTLLRAIDQRGNAVHQLQKLADAKVPELRAVLARTETLLQLMTAAQSCRCPSLDRCAEIAAERGLL